MNITYITGDYSAGNRTLGMALETHHKLAGNTVIRVDDGFIFDDNFNGKKVTGPMLLNMVRNCEQKVRLHLIFVGETSKPLMDTVKAVYNHQAFFLVSTMRIDPDA